MWGDVGRILYYNQQLRKLVKSTPREIATLNHSRVMRASHALSLLCIVHTTGSAPSLRHPHGSARLGPANPAWCCPSAMLALAGAPCARVRKVPRLGVRHRTRVAPAVMMAEEIGNPNAGGPGFKRLTGKKRFVSPERREEDWDAWLKTLTPEERAIVDQSERLSFLNADKWNATERMKEMGCGEFDKEGNFVEGSAGRSTVWDEDPDGRWILHQCPVAELPAAILRKDRFLNEHPGWFRDRPVFESIYLAVVKKPLTVPLTDFEYAELARLYMRFVSGVMCMAYCCCCCSHASGWGFLQADMPHVHPPNNPHFDPGLCSYKCTHPSLLQVSARAHCRAAV